MKRVVIVSVYFVLLIGVVSALPVFPGAEGFGSETRAAYGGTGNPNIYVVNTLADNTIAPTMGTINGVTVYKGSLRACLSDTAHTTTGQGRVILFGVSGYITLGSSLVVSQPYTTIATQTAPSPGITLKGGHDFIIRSHDILLQHMRSRPGGIGSQGVPNSACDDLDALKIQDYADYRNGYNVYNVVVDHSSFSWNTDETISIWYRAHDITISNLIVSEPLYYSCQGNPVKGHGYSFITDAYIYNVSVLRNLFVHGYQRHPLQHYGYTTMVWQNNVIYNYNLGAQIGDGDSSSHPVSYDIIENKYITGPTVANYYPIQLIALGDSSNSHIYLSGNVEDDPTPHSPIYTCDEGCSEPAANYLDGSPWNSLNLTTLDAADNGPNGLEEVVKATAGARPANRDNVDTRDVADVTDGTGGLINWQTDLGSDGLGGYQTLASNTNTFTDLPASPHADDDRDGYTNLEEWIHSYSCDVEGPQSLSCLASPPTCSCTGMPQYATSWGNDEETDLIIDTPWVYSATDTATKCEFHCNTGYLWSGSSCIQQQTNSYIILKAQTPPTVDGNLNEFANANEITITDLYGTTGTYKFLWDSNALYVAADVSDSNLNVGLSHQEDDALWDDDSLEMFMDTLNDGGTALQPDDYKFYANINKVHSDSHASDTSWDSGMANNVIATGTINNNADTDTGYVIEARIPWQNFATPSDDSVWGFDLSMDDKTDSGTIQTAWTNSDGGGFNDPEGWGDVLFSSEFVALSGSACNSDADSNGDSSISIGELINYISQWKAGGVSIGSLIDAIGKWKNGC